MNYLLVTEEQLLGQNFDYQYAERIPDGRVILQLTALKVLSNLSLEIISDDKLLELIATQKEAQEVENKDEELYPDADNPDSQPAPGDGEVNTGTNTDQLGADLEEVSETDTGQPDEPLADEVTNNELKEGETV